MSDNNFLSKFMMDDRWMMIVVSKRKMNLVQSHWQELIDWLVGWLINWLIDWLIDIDWYWLILYWFLLILIGQLLTKDELFKEWQFVADTLAQLSVAFPWWLYIYYIFVIFILWTDFMLSRILIHHILGEK